MRVINVNIFKGVKRKECNMKQLNAILITIVWRHTHEAAELYYSGTGCILLTATVERVPLLD